MHRTQSNYSVRQRYLMNSAIPQIKRELEAWPNSPQTVSAITMRELLACYDMVQQIRGLLP